MYAILGFRLGVLRLTSLGIQKTQRMGIVKRPYIDWSGQRNIEGRPFVVSFERFRNSLRKEHPRE